MNKKFKQFLLLCLITSSLLAQEIQLKNNDSIVFIGDEITQQTQYTQYLENFLITQHPKLRLKFHNAGINYSTAQSVLDRFTEDIASRKPNYAFILLGRHDASFRKFNYKDLNDFTSKLSQIIESLQNINSKVILISPPPFEAHKLEKKTIPLDYNETLAYYSSAIRELSLKYNCHFVDLHNKLNKESYYKRRVDPSDSITTDGINLKPQYNAFIAGTIIRRLGFKGLTNTLNIHFKDKKISNVKLSSGRVIKQGKHFFSIQPSYLPWYATHDYINSKGSEKLQVTGLEDGLYLLKINQKNIAYWTAEELRNGVDISRAKHSPQSRHANSIKELNAIRNGHLIALRKMWKTRIDYEKLSSLEQLTDNEKTQLKRLKPRLKNFESKQNQILAQTDKLLKQIYDISKPSKLVFELIPASSFAPISFNSTELKAGLSYTTYVSPPNTFWSQLPDFDILMTNNEGICKKPTSQVRPQADNYAIVYKGFITIPKDGLYTLTLNSDDGSKLYLNNKLIVDNDGLHAMTEKSNRVPLTKGIYPFKVEFFESVGDDNIILYWQTDGISKQEIPAEAYLTE